jgi:cell volume regulation protein A
VPVPTRLVALLELESGLNDPMSVFLTVAIVGMLAHPETMTVGHAGRLFLQEMGGGALLGLAGGQLLLGLMRWTRVHPSVLPVMALSVALLLFGGAQSLGASGFLAVYLAAATLALQGADRVQGVRQFFEALAWLAQIALFLMLGLLVTPHDLLHLIRPALIAAAVLLLLARPLAVASCLLPFGWSLRETGFVAWAGLRGGVPIYLTLIPVLANNNAGERLFGIVFVIVIASVAVQGWTIPALARRLKLTPAAES